MRNKSGSQKGIDCSVDGCVNIRTGNNLCANHNMAVHRYGSLDGKQKTKRICKNKSCKEEFEHKYDRTEYCSLKCYRAMPGNKAKVYQAVKKHRLKNIEKTRERDCLGKRTRRRFGTEGVCVVAECGDKAETHHPDYDRPYEIVWLCRQHHKDVEVGKPVFGKEDILCDVIWKELLDAYGAEHLKGKSFLRGKALFGNEAKKELSWTRRNISLNLDKVLPSYVLLERSHLYNIRA